MTDAATRSEQPRSTGTAGDRLWRWLVGGLAAGAIMLGLLVAAYAIGYHRGRGHAAASRPVATGPATTTTANPATTATAPAVGPVAVTAALVARGKSLYGSDGCSACHSLAGSAGVGPSFKGLAGSTVALTTGRQVTADDAYLARSIADPNGQIVKGYRAGVMSAAISGFGLAAKPADIRALVAFIKSQK
jgi:cytochrome c2